MLPLHIETCAGYCNWSRRARGTTVTVIEWLSELISLQQISRAYLSLAREAFPDASRTENYEIRFPPRFPSRVPSRARPRGRERLTTHWQLSLHRLSPYSMSLRLMCCIVTLTTMFDCLGP